ncbi:MAG: AMP-binding protein [Roseivirga sp.]|nr:AMP-binding protein [Roseivirga sp.]
MLQLIENAQNHPDRTAIISDGQEYSYKALFSASAQLASLLLNGLSDLDETRVAFMVAPGFDYVKVQWAIWRAGGIAVPLSLSNPLPAQEYVLKDADCSILVVDDYYHYFLEPIVDKQKIRLVRMADLVQGTDQTPLPDIAKTRRAMIIYTSGTTGQPKGVVTTHLNIESQISTLVNAWAWSKEDRILNVLPLHHVHGVINVLACALWSGACCVFVKKFEAEAVLKLLTEGEINLFMAVPTIYYKLINHWTTLGVDEHDIVKTALSKFRLMVSGSAALPVSVMEQWESISGQRLLERYGMTEIGMAISNPYKGERRPGHIGQALPGMQVRIVNETNEQVVAGESGEIQVKGSNVFREYWKRPEATSEAFTEDGWFRTGDVAKLNKGSYRILGRMSVDIIKSGGYKISALEIEEVLRTHPQINDCAVVGIPDPEWDEIIGASLVLTVPQAFDFEVLKAWLKERLPVYKIPRKYLIQKDLPRNAMGKVTKKELKAIFM